MATTMCRVTGNLSDLGLTYAQGYVLRVVPDPRTVVVGDKTLTLADFATAVVGPTGQIQFTVPADAYMTIIPTRNGNSMSGIKMRAPLRESASLISCIVTSPPVPADIQNLINVVEGAAVNTGNDRVAIAAIGAQVNTQAGQVAANKTASDMNAGTALSAQAAALAARDLAMVTLGADAKFTASTIASAIAAGIAAVADGAYFQASGEDSQEVQLRRRSGSGSTLMWSQPKDTAVNFHLPDFRLGQFPANDTGSVFTGPYWHEIGAVTCDCTLKTLSIKCNAGAVTVYAATKSGNKYTARRVGRFVAPVTGVNTIAGNDMKFFAGEVVMVYAPQGVFRTFPLAGLSNTYQTTSILVGVESAGSTTNANVRIEIGAVLTPVTAAEAAKALNTNDAAASVVCGVPKASLAAAVAWANNIWAAPDYTAPMDGVVTEVSAWGTSAGVIQVSVCTKNADGTLTATATASGDVGSGLGTITCALPILRGQVLAVRHTGTIHYRAAGQGGVSMVRFGSAPTVNSVPGGTNFDIEPMISFTVEGRLAARVTANERALVGVSGATISALDQIVNGTNSLWQFTEQAGTGIYTRLWQSVSVVAGTTYKFRVRGKGDVRQRLGLYSNAAVLIDVSGNFVTGTSVVHSWAATAAMTYLANGAWELEVTATATASGGTNLQLVMLDTNIPSAARSPDGTGTIFVHSVEMSIGNGPNILPNSTNFSAWSNNQNLILTANAGKYLGLLGQQSAPAERHPLFGKKIALLGTSLVAGGQLTPALANATGATVQQLGFSGGALGLDARTTPGFPHPGSGAIMGLLDSIASDTDVILLDMLVNDIAASDVPLGNRTSTTQSTYYGALSMFFDWCETNRPNAAPCLTVPTAAGIAFAVADYRHNQPNANGNTVWDFQVATREAAILAGRPCIDPNRWGMGFRDMPAATSDSLHWDSSGANKLGGFIYPKELRDFCEAGWLVAA